MIRDLTITVFGLIVGVGIGILLCGSGVFGRCKAVEGSECDMKGKKKKGGKKC